jgi:hypothetical protein
LNEICDELIAYEAENGNQWTKVYSQTFKDMKTRQNFEEKYMDKYLVGLKGGKKHHAEIAVFRNDSSKVTIEKILARNPKVLEWWNNI